MSEFLLHAVELLPNGKNGLRSTSARKVRAAEIRAQRLDGAQACGETAVHAPQSSAAGSGGVAGTVALEQFPRLLVWRSRAGGSKQMGRPQNEDTSARTLRAKSIVAGGADRPLLENREKWRTPVPSGQQNQDGHKLYSPRRRGPPAKTHHGKD
jgi:hypothetical protein